VGGDVCKARYRRSEPEPDDHLAVCKLPSLIQTENVRITFGVLGQQTAYGVLTAIVDDVERFRAYPPSEAAERI
jgi:hypothetical protein